MDAVGRSKNFSSIDREVLAKLVEKYQDVVLSKDSKKNSINEKNRAWDEITTEFNTEVDDKRTSKQLKAAWHNMKVRSKEKFRAQRLEVLKTGGGPPPPPDTPVNEKIHDLLKDQIKPHENPYDDDSLLDSPILEVLDDGGCAYTIKAVNFAAMKPVDQCHVPTTSIQETQQNGKGVEEKRLVSSEEKLFSFAASAPEAKALYYHKKLKYLQSKDERETKLYAKKMKLTELLIKNFPRKQDQGTSKI